MVGRPQDWGLYLLGYMCETIYAANAERVRCEDPKDLKDIPLKLKNPVSSPLTGFSYLRE